MYIFELIVVQPIFNLLLALYSLIPFADFGIAVIIFTIFIRFAMWPLVVKQLHQVKAMRKLQPELARIKKQNKGNRQAESMQMLDLYKKHGVKPFRSILMLLIQLPIFISLFQVIQIFTTHRDQIEKFTYGFMQNIDAVKALIANTDSFNPMFLGIVDITRSAITADGISWFLVILAGIAAFTQYIISKQTSPQTSTKRLRDVLAEAGTGKEPDQAELNAIMMSKMIKILPVMMFFIMMSLPGALGLYYTTSNIFAAIQQHFLLKRDAQELDELAEKELKKASGGKKATAKARARDAREAETITASKAKSGKEAKAPSSKSIDPKVAKVTKVAKTTKTDDTKVTRITAKDTPRK